MIILLVVAVVAAAVSCLTLFSGFGLGTLLLPTFALFFPLAIAVAATAVVHGANSLFKVFLLGRHARRSVVLAFGIPAVLTAWIGALLLARLSENSQVLKTWFIGSFRAEITPIGLVLGILILIFGLLEIAPASKKLQLGPRWLPVGGLLAGFFGGLSGHQGALRATFLSRLGMTPAAFAGTQAVLALMVDVSRLIVYGSSRLGASLGAAEWRLVGAATLAAFGGALLGKKLLPKVTVNTLRWITGSLLLVVGAGLASGLL